MNPLTKSRFSPLAAGVVFCGALALFLAGLAANEILMIDTRFALFVAEMFERGIGPYPHLYGEYYPDYNSIPTALMAAASLLAGGISQLSLALPGALAAAAMLAVTCRIGSEFRSTRFGVMAAMLAVLSFEFLNICRIASIDLYPALAAAAAFLLAWRAAEHDRSPLSGWLLLCMAAGYLTRGPLGVMIPFAAAAAVPLAFRRYKPFLQLAAAALLLTGILASLWLGWAYRAGGSEFFRQVIDMQFSSRFQASKPVWYYFTNAAGSYAAVYPLGLLAALLVLRRARLRTPPETRDETFLQALALWMLLILGGMSLPGTKHLRYVVGVIPPAALLTAAMLENRGHSRFCRRLRKFFFLAARYFPALLLAGLPLLWCVRFPAAERLLRFNQPFDFSRCLTAVPVLALLLCLNRIPCAPRKRQFLLLANAVIGFAVLHIAVLEEYQQSTQGSARFVTKAEEIRPADAPLWFAGLGPDGDENKYLWNVAPERRFVPRYMLRERVTDDDGNALSDEHGDPLFELRYRSPSGAEVPPPRSGEWCLVRVDKWRKNFDEPFRAEYETVLTGRLGHRDAALLRKR